MSHALVYHRGDDIVRSRSFSYPEKDYDLPDVDGHALCRREVCAHCERSPESVLVHLDCCAVFLYQCRGLDKGDVLERLWTLAAWKRPWARAPPLRLHLPAVDLSAIGTQADDPLLSRLKRLPCELIQVIRSYSLHAWLWRLSRVVKMVARSLVMSSMSLSIPLERVAPWRRGEPFKPMARPPPVTRLTIDCDGVSRIEHLDGYPAYSAALGDMDSLAYIILEGAVLSEVSASFRVSISTFDPHIWANEQGWLCPARIILRPEMPPNMGLPKPTATWAMPFLSSLGSLSSRSKHPGVLAESSYC